MASSQATPPWHTSSLVKSITDSAHRVLITSFRLFYDRKKRHGDKMGYSTLFIRILQILPVNGVPILGKFRILGNTGMYVVLF